MPFRFPQHGFQTIGNLQKADFAAEERVHRFFARAVERAGIVIPRLARLQRHGKAREFFPLERQKMQCRQLFEIQAFATGKPPGIGERQLDGQFHGRNAQLRDDGAVLEFRHGMYHAFGMHQRVNFRKRGVVQMMRFDDFEALV